MSDQRLRELERRWRETGSVEDEAAYLRERVRVGDLTQERLELAAHCGHEGARRALGQEPIAPPRSPSETTSWLRSLPQAPHEVLVRAALQAARNGVAAGDNHAKRGRFRERVIEAKRAVSAVEKWLACPCLRHEEPLTEFMYFGESQPGVRESADLAGAITAVVLFKSTDAEQVLGPFVEHQDSWWRMCRTNAPNLIGQTLAFVIGGAALERR